MIQLRFLLQIPITAEVQFERYSDSAGTYVVLDSNNPAIYKQLYRAAKAKLKLRLKATITRSKQPEEAQAMEDNSVPESAKRNTYLETVLSKPQSDVTYFKPFEVLLNDKTPQATKEDPKREKELSRPTLPTLHDFCTSTFSIDCNHCNRSVANEHYHCGKCEMGDFDLCPSCIEQGVTCDGEDHWLIKRTIMNGKVYSSNTETLPSKKPEPVTEVKPEITVDEEDQRTCNSCIIRKLCLYERPNMVANRYQNLDLLPLSHVNNVLIMTCASSVSSMVSMATIQLIHLHPWKRMLRVMLDSSSCSVIQPVA